MTRTVRILLPLLAVAVLGTACGSGSSQSGSGSDNVITPAQCTSKGLTVASGSATAAPPSGQQPVTLNVWSFYTGREFEQYCEVLQDFHQKYPWISIEHTGGKTDQDVLRAVSANTAPDLFISSGASNVAKFCSSGSFSDLTPNLQQDNVDLAATIPAGPLSYSGFNGSQCTLPVLSDAYGLYYNLDLFEKAGINDPPRTFSEFTETAKKLTEFNPDGSIKVAGWVPLYGFYENPNFFIGPYNGGEWYDDQGKSAFGSDPSWASMLEWQKQTIDEIYGADGYKKLQDFVAQLGGPNSEWSTDQAFETGKVAMAVDGEWRIAFIEGDKSNVNYATAPAPVADDMADSYGLGEVNGDVVGIPSNAKEPAASWLLLKYLALDEGAQAKLADVLKNVPTNLNVMKLPQFADNKYFKPFMDISANPNSSFKQQTAIGQTDEDLWAAFVDKWEAGQVPDLQAGLQDLANQIDQQLQLG